MLLSVAAFASAANMRVIDPLLVQLAATFAVSVGAASIAATAFLFANGVFVLVHGPFGDRYGKMPVVAIACIMAALCCLLSALADSLAWLAAARFLTGVTSSAIIPLAIAWLGDNVSYERRQATLARFLTGQTLGLMTGAALGRRARRLAGLALGVLGAGSRSTSRRAPRCSASCAPIPPWRDRPAVTRAR